MTKTVKNKVSKNILIAICCIMMMLLFVITFIKVTSNSEPVHYSMYVVQHGDTLWSIAKESNGYGKVDIQQIIWDMKEYSNCSAELQPGQVIYIPQY